MDSDRHAARARGVIIPLQGPLVAFVKMAVAIESPRGGRNDNTPSEDFMPGGVYPGPGGYRFGPLRIGFENRGFYRIHIGCTHGFLPRK
jgi:hypothetical protein